jgi:hypothetical protein
VRPRALPPSRYRPSTRSRPAHLGRRRQHRGVRLRPAPPARR